MDGPQDGSFVGLAALQTMAKFSPFKFLQEVRDETDKVTWPTRRETAITTVMVFVMVLVSSIFFLLADQVIRLFITTSSVDARVEPHEAEHKDMAKRWYIVHAYSNFENKVAESIREQAKQRGLTDQFEEVMVPEGKGHRGAPRPQGRYRAQVLSRAMCW